MKNNSKLLTAAIYITILAMAISGVAMMKAVAAIKPHTPPTPTSLPIQDTNGVFIDCIVNGVPQGVVTMVRFDDMNGRIGAFTCSFP